MPSIPHIYTFPYTTLFRSLTTVAAFLPKGPLLLGVLLVVAGGTLGLFPCYYSFTQDLGKQHVGKISGLDRKSTRLNSSHLGISYDVFCLKKNTYNKNIEIF